ARAWLRAQAPEGLYGVLFPDASSTEEATTAAVDARGFESYHDSYATEQRILRQATGSGPTVDRSDFTYLAGYDSTDLPAGIKPYLPGLLAPTWSGIVADQDSPYQLDKIAGVDALGLLLGAIAMAPERPGGSNNPDSAESISLFRGVVNAANRTVAVELDEYFRIETGLPFAPTTSASIAGAEYRLARSDLERMTTIVPSIAEVRAGDLIVRYDTAGSPHVGIVVETRWDTPPTPTARAADYWNDIVVVSVRRGFRMVALGTWGNPAGSFGGFTTEPEAYHIRRLLVAPNGVNATEHYEPEGWEIQEVIERTRDFYAVEREVPLPRYASYIGEDVYEIYKNGWRFLRYLPPTSYSSRLRSLFGLSHMQFTENTGWRDYNLQSSAVSPGQPLGNIVSYHQGLDFYGGHDIVAPTDGWLMFVDEQTLRRFDLPTGGSIDLFADFGGISTQDRPLYEYEYETFGVIGLFVTKGVDGEPERIMLVAHQGTNGQGRSEALNMLDAAFTVSDDHPGAMFPRNTWIDVDSGDWIGRMGNNGLGTGAHVHLEVFEYFAEDALGMPLGRWRRIDPITVFTRDAYTSAIGTLVALPAQGPYDLSWTPNAASYADTSYVVQDFLTWRLREPPEGEKPISAERAELIGRDHFRPWPYVEGSDQ
ncbi:MAG: M23 family metallopeptidase, partial [Spirochaetales bacterium]|nr:M23 family metallopeptidase [Spirochaetales bacterium]